MKVVEEASRPFTPSNKPMSKLNKQDVPRLKACAFHHPRQTPAYPKLVEICEKSPYLAKETMIQL